VIASGGKILLLAAIALAITAGRASADRVDELTRILDEDRGEKAKIAAAVALGNLGDARGVPALVRALADASPVVRGLAASALGHIGDERALPSLERALSETDIWKFGRAYNMHCEAVDGMDVIAIRDVAGRAVERARAD